MLSRYRPALVLAGIFLLVSALTRAALWGLARDSVPPRAETLLQVFGVGTLFDLVTAAYFCAPLVAYLALLPNALARQRWHRMLFLAGMLVWIYALWVTAAAEWIFWDEFDSRFNFIAVDYLVYTQEVLGNIWQSYPVGKALLALGLPALGLAWLCRRPLLAGAAAETPLLGRLALGASLLALPVASFLLVTTDLKERSANVQLNELSGNGIYEFFAAAYNNELDYERFYAVLPPQQALRQARELLASRDARYLSDVPSDLERAITAGGPEKRLNIVLVSVESLGTEFLGAFGNTEGITPNLDALATEGLLFTNVYATGNRTVRGLEALALSIPPTPGQSIVKRPRNEEMFTLGCVLEDKGYESKFVYGGYSYFDNMGYFFGHNDYEVVDRSALAKKDIHYENIWGVADEDLFTLALREMDKTHARGGAGKPFFLHVMTTSNHRPYTYPESRIDIPSGTGRAGAVKYTDYAIGKFLREARSHPWFDDTLFVITADHGASARGMVAIPVERYRIPLLIYAPKHVKPARIDRLMSQIDIPPTLLGLLNFSYLSRFFGYDIFKLEPGRERALVANYQTLGYMRAGRMVTLAPQRKVSVQSLEGVEPGPASGITDEQLRQEAIAYYLVAAYLFRNQLYSDQEQIPPPDRATTLKTR